ncbi:slipin family protein [bacterium]|nr:slipin family protein [bacterium]
MLKFKRVNNYQVGLRFKNDKLVEALLPSWYITKEILGERIDILSEKDLLVSHPELNEIIQSGLLDEFLEVVDLKDNERALLWVDGRFERILSTGKHAIWKRFRELRIERISTDDPRFDHKMLFKISQNSKSEAVLRSILIEPFETCLYYKDGCFVSELGPGYYSFWKDSGTLKFVKIDLREKLLDMAGQEIITLDKVSLRLNAIISYRVVNARKSVQISETPDQAIYRECQLILRSSIGSRKLDDILIDKNVLTNEILEIVKSKADQFGLEIVYFGIRDIILPGDIKELMNRVVGAQKEAEANQIVRREETAATRSQCNTAKMLEQNPTLMRLRELEVLERVAEKSKLNLVISEKGLTDKLVNML